MIENVELLLLNYKTDSNRDFEGKYWTGHSLNSDQWKEKQDFTVTAMIIR